MEEAEGMFERGGMTSEVFHGPGHCTFQADQVAEMEKFKGGGARGHGWVSPRHLPT